MDQLLWTLAEPVASVAMHQMQMEDRVVMALLVTGAQPEGEMVEAEETQALLVEVLEGTAE